jgi:hypothetical protein
VRRGARRLVPLACALALSGCTRSYSPADIEGGDLQSRYPPVVEQASRGLVRAAAVALVLFVAWLAADVALRRAGRQGQGGALLTATALIAFLTIGALVVGASGAYPTGEPYEIAVLVSDWMGPLSIVAGITWMVRGFRTGPGDRGEAVWGLFLVMVGAIVTVMIVTSAYKLWICC